MLAARTQLFFKMPWKYVSHLNADGRSSINQTRFQTHPGGF